MQNGPKMKWTFMSLQILDDVRQGKMSFAEMFPRARAAGFVAYDASDMDAEFASREEVLALCRDAGLRIADYIHWVHMTDPDEAGVQAAIESGKQAVHTALAHGTHKLMIVENVVPEDLARMTREEAAQIAGAQIGGGIEEISVRAARELVSMQMKGELKLDPQVYLSDASFARLLREMPARSAVKVYERLVAGKPSGENARAAASPGLPAPMRADTPASGARDYSGMSDAEFRRIKESYRRAAQNGMHVRL